MNHIKQLNKLNACSAAVKYAKKFETLQSAWDSCERAEWMFWLIGKTTQSKAWSDERKPIVLCALECAETVKHLWPKKQEKQIENSIDVLKKWCDGEVDTENAKEARDALRAAAYAAADAADAADADAAAAAAAAADAAAAAYAAAAYAAAAAAYAAADAAAAAYAADAYAATATAADVRKQCANIVRGYYPQAPQLKEVA